MIYCFSGTGNSRYVADMLTSALGTEDNDVIGIVFPVHAWGIPKMFEQQLDDWGLTPETMDGKYVFLVMTCGTEAGYCERTFPYRFDAAFSVIMPNTYVGLPLFGVDGIKLEQKKIDKAAERVKMIAETVRERRLVIDVKRGIWPWLMTYKIRPWFSRHLAVARNINIDNDICNGCGRCVKQCPMQNIYIDDNTSRPVHGEKCCLCLGCYHHCPKKAIWVGPCGKGKGQKQLP